MVSRVVFLVEAKFNKRDFERFGVQLLQENGFVVEVWELANVLHHQYTKEFVPPDPYTFDGLREFATRREVIGAIAELHDDDVVVAPIGYGRKYFFIYRALSRTGVRYGAVELNALPPVPAERRLFRRMNRAVRNPSRVIDYLLNRIPSTIIGISSVTFILAGGEQSVTRKYLMNHRTSVLWCHTLDYDVYLKEKDRAAVGAKADYAVFLDEYLPFHPDFQIQGVEAPIAPDEYYGSLRSFFFHAERLLGYSIIVAAHPSSDYAMKPDYFGGRSVVRGQTASLIRGARIVFAHSSTALNYAVLFEKPSVFLTSNALGQSHTGRYIAEMAKWLGKNPVNADEPDRFDIKKEFVVNHEAYDTYRRLFIKKPGSPDKMCWQIVADYLKDPSK
jgi:hypothetical protein